MKKQSNPGPPQEVIRATTKQITKTFTEWDRIYREDPDKFMNEATRLLKETPEDYGEACTPYFLKLLEKIKRTHPS